MKTRKTNSKNLIAGTRIPVSFLLDYIKEGYTISDFISSYPWVSKKKVVEALEEIKRREFTSAYAL